MDPSSLRSPANDAVLDYLAVEQLPEWRESTSPWVVDGYPLTTHPDLCERIDAINAAAGTKAALHFLYGRPALLSDSCTIVCFATGTHVLCLRLPATECDPDLRVERTQEWSRFDVLREKQLELARLADGNEWTRLDPWAVNVPRAEAVTRLASLLSRALAGA